MSGNILGASERCPNANWLDEFAGLNEEDRRSANLSRTPLAAAEAEIRFVAATALGNACTFAPDCQLGPEGHCPIDKVVLLFAFEMPPPAEPEVSV